ncbi:MAG: helix-turn-helix domain-containing protein [Firmicutes bacterium]|uniref:DNA-binding protein Rv2175c wHTH domain-containing protein n=1 Tax=Melghirimyces thermohalophilus TaxID=1236220 RepID=A0A1G6KLJ7_9BACL|nr:helix-turn-helix domain-containing protein [Melghirimyces thermohalophilus]MDA8353570.1 helix-turn-helix domain-containing protein [Bacillota bacterium]SDC31982.1 hypothetical protein SAMN04488112_10651 [Melghirimyces thermohalophilus]
MPFSHMDENRVTPVDPRERWYTVDDVAERFGVPMKRVQDLVLTEQLQGMEQDGVFWIREEELDQARDLLEKEAVPQDGEGKEILRETDPENPPHVEATAEEETKGDVIPIHHQEHRQEDDGGSEIGERWKEAFEKATAQLEKMKKPLSRLRFKEWIGQFFQMIDEKKRDEVRQEKVDRQVSVKLGFMTGKNELFCDFCEIDDHFYPGAIFADIYVEGSLKWMMCPNCLNYCRQQANGSMEQNIRARFNQLAFRLEREARRARNLAASEDFRVPPLHEWDAWETASMAMQEVAATYSQDPAEYEASPGFDPSDQDRE